jgi:PAS domain S-box-containing protein
VKILKRYLTFSSLRFRLGLLIILAILPMFGLALYTYMEERNFAISNVEGDVQQFAGSASAFQEQLIEGTRQLLVALTKHPDIQDQDPTLCSRHFAEMSTEYSRYANLGVIRLDGEPFCLASPIGAGAADFKAQPWFQKTIETRDLVLAAARGEYTSGRAVLNLSYPLMEAPGKITGVVFAALDLEQLNQITGEVQMPDETEFIMIDRRGTVLAYLPDSDRWLGRTLRDSPLISAILSRGQDIADLRGLDGMERLYAFTPLRSTVETELYVGIGIPTAIAYREANQTLARHLAGLGLITIVALLAVWFGSDVLILRRVKALVGAAKRLSSGEMTARTGLTVGTGELDQLARTFDEMAGALEHKTLQLSQAETKYRTLVEQLPVITYIAWPDEMRSTLYISPQVLTILGYSPEAWIADPLLWLRQIHPEDRPQVLEKLAPGRPLEQTDGFKAEYRMFACDGRMLHVSDEAMIVREGATARLSLHGVMRDISEQKEAQAQLLGYQEQLRSLASELSLAEERERRRIATELHDRVGQALAVSKMKLGVLRENASAADQGEWIDDIRSLIEQAIQETRSLIFEISSPILYELGLEAALEWLAEKMEQQRALSCRYRDDGQPKVLEEDLRVLLFQATRELLVNVARHAQANQVGISTRRDGNRMVVVVEDDGLGFDPSKISSWWAKNRGFGLFSIGERLKYVGGSLKVESQPGRGTRITLSVPLKDPGRKAVSGT